MDLIELIFKLVLKFVPISDTDYKSMYQGAQDWKLKLRDDSDNKIEAMYSKYSAEWYVKLIIAVAYIPLVRSIMNFMNPSEDDEEV